MSVALVNKLLESFDELVRCIGITRQTLSVKPGVPEDVLARVETYSGIVKKQRSLATELRNHIATQNWEEVGRHVRLINGLSSMIRDDAQSILAGAYGQNPVRLQLEGEKDDQILC